MLPESHDTGYDHEVIQSEGEVPKQQHADHVQVVG
jgi:hypothetical protein